jgi:hypothetical protein
MKSVISDKVKKIFNDVEFYPDKVEPVASPAVINEYSYLVPKHNENFDIQKGIKDEIDWVYSEMAYLIENKHFFKITGENTVYVSVKIRTLANKYEFAGKVVEHLREVFNEHCDYSDNYYYIFIDIN